MNRHLLLLVLIFPSAWMSQTLQAQISNPGFENWSQTILFENPDDYITFNTQAYLSTMSGNVTKVTGQTGNYAARLQTVTNGQDTFPGLLMLGDMGIFGTNKYPFTGQADTLRVWLRYNILPGDTSFIGWIPSRLGFPLAYDVIPIIGSQPGFAQFTFPLTHTILPPDSIIFIATSSNFDGGIPGSWLEIDHIELLGSTQQLPNADFENWTAVAFEDADSWWSTNFFLVASGQLPSVVKSTDAHSGTYALSITTRTLLMFGGDTLTLATNGVFGQDGPEGGDAYNDRPEKLSGYYKYTPVGTDSALVYLRLQKWNTLTHARDSIGGVMAKLGPASTYTKFEIPIDYYLPDNPDSVVVALASSNFNSPNNPAQPGSQLLVDDLAFEFPAGVSVPLNMAMTDPRIYPNPTKGQLFIEMAEKGSAETEIKLFNLIGKEVTDQIVQRFDPNRNQYTLSVQGLEPGVYIYMIQVNGKIQSGKFNKQ